MLPGAERFDEILEKEIADTKIARGPGYVPRTRHCLPDGTPRYTNRLFLETSTYLQQHAHNPVNWYPWGQAAFERAQKLDRPILLSIGYSTCHWCHVMEEESFEDEEIASYLNENYVTIKVDREERPDVDAVYMSAIQLISGGGGWPMTVWLTAEKKPFFGGTYFPARDGDRGVRMGFLSVIKKLREAYAEERQEVSLSSDRVTEAIQKMLASEAVSDTPTPKAISDAVEYYKSRFDWNHGGLAGAPKFPSSFPVRLLLRFNRRFPDNGLLSMLTKSLEMMAAGGMYDQIGGGFHRYSTDSKWLVPHFEKMLYDNALLVMAYLEGFQVTKNREFKRVVDEILGYVKREMTSPHGGFYAATDADSLNPSGEREEGWFFTWTLEELGAVLDTKELAFTKLYYDMTAGGNFEGRNVLHTTQHLSEVASKLAISEEDALKLRATIREKLYQAREKRPHPIRDEKILTSWNALMISAFVKASFTLDKPQYLAIGEAAANFILQNLKQGQRLFRVFKDGKAKFNAYLDDYAFFVAALIDLYEVTGALGWLKEAMALDEILHEHFEDKAGGGFYLTSDDHERLLCREKPGYDGAEPCGNSVAVLNLLRLHALTGNDAYRVRAEMVFKCFGTTLHARPMALSEMLIALDFYHDKPKAIILISPSGKKEELEPFLSKLRGAYLPNCVLSLVQVGETSWASKVVPLVEGKDLIDGGTAAFVCDQGGCRLPTNDATIFGRQIA